MDSFTNLVDPTTPVLRSFPLLLPSRRQHIQVVLEELIRPLLLLLLLLLLLPKVRR